MTVVGTGVAAGVAQTAATAQQVARRKDKRAQQSGQDADRVREMIETHLRGLEEGDEATLGSVTQLHVDGQLPEHQPPQTAVPDLPQGRGEQDESGDGRQMAADGDAEPAAKDEHSQPVATSKRHVEGDEPVDAPDGSADAARPYKHLDVRA